MQPGGSAADETGWQQYENSNFVAYSNAGSNSVAGILESLEIFRAAALQIPTFVIPEGRPKTLVILPATHEEFLEYAWYETVAGFATVLAGQPTIVLPANEPNQDIRVIVGHEFAHTLLFNDYFSYPSWYAEGFAEIASSIVVDQKKNTLTIGARDDLRKKAKNPRIDWNDLVGETFNAHSLGDIDLTASAYAQDWLLVHYLTLNDSRDFASQLNSYFANINNGQPGLMAFTDAFEKSALDFGTEDLPPYLGKITNLQFSFDPSLPDLDYDVEHARDEKLRPILKFLKDYANARHGRNAPAEPQASLSGKWDWLRLDDQCLDPLTFHVRIDTNVLVLESFYSDDEAEPVPALFSIEAADGGALRLTNITSVEYPQVRVTSDYRAVMRSEDVMCFDAQPAARDCLRILQRCD